MSNFEKVKVFMKTFGQEVKEKPDFPNDKITTLRCDLIEEELKELKDAIEKRYQRGCRCTYRHIIRNLWSRTFLWHKLRSLL